MTTQILEPTHLSINSGHEVSRRNRSDTEDVPSGRSCEAILLEIDVEWVGVGGGG